MKDGSATLITGDGKSIAIGQLGPAVEAAGFTPGELGRPMHMEAKGGKLCM